MIVHMMLGCMLCILGFLNCFASLVNVIKNVPHPFTNSTAPHVLNFTIWAIVFAAGVTLIRLVGACHG